MKCIVLDNVYIPGVGQGPILKPFDANGRGIRTAVKNASKNYIFFPDNQIDRYVKKEVVEATEIVETITKPNINQGIVEVNNEEMMNIILGSKKAVEEEVIEDVEEAVEEVIENVEEVEEVVEETIEEVEEVVIQEVEYKEEDLEELTVSELKEILKAKDIKFLYKDTKQILIDKILNR